MIVTSERDPRWRAAHEEDAGHVRADLDGARDRGRRVAALVRSIFEGSRWRDGRRRA